MTTRTAELVMALVCALLSVAFMVKSAELHIGWVEGRGPGAGAWPFWLSGGMLAASLVTLWRWWRRVTPESRSRKSYLARDQAPAVGISAGAILFLLAATHLVGIYAALVLFLLFYLRFIGRHSWQLSLALTFAVPALIFCLFEWALKIPLPKSITEPLFYPVYELIY
ncbi:MAG: tripartite tricarboxylate transporter TctB family protein [Gammaproteobacteria bacterium]|nr:tripartite tricarboxylate transporter TctB family protein [Gammaproteobacteria bacterium]